jgi:hypothetical protein
MSFLLYSYFLFHFAHIHVPLVVLICSIDAKIPSSLCTLDLFHGQKILVPCILSFLFLIDVIFVPRVIKFLFLVIFVQGKYLL